MILLGVVLMLSSNASFASSVTDKVADDFIEVPTMDKVDGIAVIIKNHIPQLFNGEPTNVNIVVYGDSADAIVSVLKTDYHVKNAFVSKFNSEFIGKCDNCGVVGLIDILTDENCFEKSEAFIPYPIDNSFTIGTETNTKTIPIRILGGNETSLANRGSMERITGESFERRLSGNKKATNENEYLIRISRKWIWS